MKDEVREWSGAKRVKQWLFLGVQKVATKARHEH